MTDTQARSPAGGAQITGRDPVLPHLRQGPAGLSIQFKKVLPARAVVVNDCGIEPLLSEKRSELID